MFFDCVFGMLSSMDLMSVGQVRMVSGGLVIAGFMMRGGFVVMMRSLFVIFRCLLVMICSFLRHGYHPLV
jgi:hypothetical protein